MLWCATVTCNDLLHQKLAQRRLAKIQWQKHFAKVISQFIQWATKVFFCDNNDFGNDNVRSTVLVSYIFVQTFSSFSCVSHSF